jgi:hypothetical protein
MIEGNHKRNCQEMKGRNGMEVKNLFSTKVNFHLSSIFQKGIMNISKNHKYQIKSKFTGCGFIVIIRKEERRME